MKSLSVLLLLANIPRVVSSSQFVLAVQPQLAVPGNNSILYCQDPSNYIFDLDYVNLTPNPPQQGKNLSIEVAGTSSQTIDAGAKIFIQVKIGRFTIIRREYDFCDTLDIVNLTCPLEKGHRKIIKEVHVPGGFPRGLYSVSADAYTPEHEQAITCLDGTFLL